MAINRCQFFCCIIYIGFISCKKEIKPLSIIQRSVNAHGGIEKWKALKSLSFTKKTIFYKEDGSFESERFQDQAFQFGENLSITIHSILDSTSYQLNNDQIYLQQGNSYIELSDKELGEKRISFASALYVCSQPFNLLESEATFERRQDTIIGDKNVFAIRVHYKTDTPSSDQWTYYFDQNSFLIAGYKVLYNQRTSMVENTKYDTTTPFVFNRTRKSTIVENEKPNFVVAEYSYSNYKVGFH